MKGGQTPATAPLWLLALVALSGTTAMHMFVPALPDAALEFDVGTGAARMAISTYVAGVAIGHLLYGPLSDAYGRRPMLLLGLTMYVAGGVACLLAPGLGPLLAGRFVQALGGCAGLSLGRVILRDTTPADTAVRQFAMLNLIILVSPGVAPFIGGWLSEQGGWRSIFALLTAAGLGTLVLVWQRLAETTQPTRHLSMAKLAGDYRALAGSRQFLGLVIAGGCGTTSFYAFLAATPFIVMDEWHRPAHWVGVLASALIVGMVVGNGIASRVASLWGTACLLRRGSVLSLASAVILWVLTLLDRNEVATTAGLMLLFTCGAGMVSPTVLVRTLNTDAGRVVSASGLYGFTQMSIGAACTALGTIGSRPALSAACVMVGATALSLVLMNRATRGED